MSAPPLAAISNLDGRRSGKEPAILCYALGGGLGHLTRTRAALYTLGIDERTALVMSPMAMARDRRVVGDACPIIAPLEQERYRNGLGAWVEKMVKEIGPTRLLLDAFPSGILGELHDTSLLHDLSIIHLARRLRWSVYAPMLKGKGLRFDQVYRLEELEPEHERYLRDHAGTIDDLALADPPICAGDDEDRVIASLRDGARPLWIIVHAGSREEVLELARMAAGVPGAGRGPSRVVVVSPGAVVDGFECVDIYPASLLFPIADRIITAGGFNVMRQAAPFRERHTAYPLTRRFDDQRWRVGQSRGG